MVFLFVFGQVGMVGVFILMAVGVIPARIANMTVRRVAMAFFFVLAVRQVYGIVGAIDGRVGIDVATLVLTWAALVLGAGLLGGMYREIVVKGHVRAEVTEVVKWDEE